MSSRHTRSGISPTSPSALGRVGAWVLNDWQLSGVLTAGSANHDNDNQTGGRYDLTYNYENNGTNMNLTGSPDYAARIVYVGDPGSGCSSDQYRQFNTAAVTGPTYGSVGLESGRNLLGGCPDKTVDLALAQNIRLRRRAHAPVPPGRVQRVQHRRHQQPQTGT